MIQIDDWWGTVLGGRQSVPTLTHCLPVLIRTQSRSGWHLIWESPQFFIMMQRVYCCCWVGGTVKVDRLLTSSLSPSHHSIAEIFCCWLKSSVSNNIQHNVRTPLSLGTALHPIPPLGSDNDVIVILTVEYWCWSDCDWYGHNYVVGDYHCRSIHFFANCCIDKAQELCCDLVNIFLVMAVELQW